MKNYQNKIPYIIVLGFCLINVAFVGLGRENKVRLPFFNWCLFCSADPQFVKYYEVQIQKPNAEKIILSNRNNRNQKDSIRVTNIISLHSQSQLTPARLKEILGSEKATVTLYEVNCDVHQWFIHKDCGPTKMLGAYEI